MGDKAQAATPAVVTVYSQPGCQPCRATHKRLQALGVDHSYIDVTQEPEALDTIKALGYATTPVVQVTCPVPNAKPVTVSWSGMRYDAMNALAKVASGDSGADTLLPFDKAGQV